MTIFICRDYSVMFGEECGCEYREVSPGEWEFRYQGSGFGQTDWMEIPEKSLDDIRANGHNPVEVE